MSPNFIRFIPICLSAIPVLIAQPLYAAETIIDFNIGAQSLADALLEFSQTSGLKIFYSAEMTKNIKTSGLNGQYTAQQGLQKLLNDTGLQYKYTGNETVTIENAPASPQINKADPTTLPKVTVVGNAAYDVTTPYNEDYVLPNATAGTKTDTPIMETPLNVQVISKQVMKDQQVIRLDQALQNISGVTTGNSLGSVGQGGTSQAITLRGFASNTFFRNGFRLQDGAATREMANVESVEVLKGPAAILYGLVEPGGMVNVITKQPQATPYYALNQQFGSYNMYRTTVDATGPVASNKDVLYRMNMSYENSGSFRDFVQNEKFYVAPVIKWNFSPRTQATLELEYNHDNLGVDTQFAPLLNNQFIQIPRHLNYAGPGATGQQDTFFGGFNWSHQLSDDWTIKHSFAVNQQSTNRLAVIPFSPAAFGLNQAVIPADLFQTQNRLNTYSTNLDITGHFDTAGIKHTLLVGGDYYRIDSTYNRMNGDYGLSIYPDMFNPFPSSQPFGGMVLNPNSAFTYNQKTDQFGLYLQDQIKLPYEFHFTGGLRYQYIHQNGRTQMPGYGYDAKDPVLTADAITPRVGLLWHPEDWLSLYSNYAESFGANAGKMAPSPGAALPPSSAQQWEVGAKTEFFEGRLRATLAYFDLTKTNVATSDPNPDLAAQGFSVVSGAVRSRGPELDIQGEIIPGWNVIATYANTDIVVTKASDTGFPAAGSRFYNVPRNTGSVWNTYDFQQEPLRGLKIGGGVKLRDGQLACCTYTNVPGYATVDLLAAYSLKLGKSKITAQLNVNNLLDKYYLTYANVDSTVVTSNGFDGAYVNFGAPRSVMGSIKVEF